MPKQSPGTLDRAFYYSYKIVRYILKSNALFKLLHNTYRYLPERYYGEQILLGRIKLGTKNAR